MPVTASHPAPRRIGWVRSLLASPGRRLGLGVFLGFATLIGGTIWRMRSLDGLLDVGDPFDVAEVQRPVEIPDADNAFVAYAAASRALARPQKADDNDPWYLLRNAVFGFEREPASWSSADRRFRDYLESRRAALEIWREGSSRRDALSVQPGRMTYDSSISPLVEDGIVLAALASLEGLRLEEAGAPEEAWGWYRAILRSSRLVGRHGGLGERHFGARLHALACRRILRWASDPRLGAGPLRRALDDALADDTLTPPVSDAIKILYLMSLGLLDNGSVYVSARRSYGSPMAVLGGRKPGALDWLLPWNLRAPAHRFMLVARNDAERSRRVLRLLYANWLAQVDRPPGLRARPAIRDPIWIYADDPSAPPSARAVHPEVLARVIDRAEIARFALDPGSRRDNQPWEPMWETRGELGLERRRRSVLIIRLAAELYRREHGTIPATAGALLGTALKELPEGIAAGDPIPAGPE